MKIGPSIPLQVLKVSSTETGKGSEGPRHAHLSLTVGQFLKATVVGISEDGLLQLSTDGQIITARSEVGFSPGSEVWLEVVKNGDPPQLSVATGKMAIVELLKDFFANSSIIREAFAGISQLLADNLHDKGLKMGKMNELLSLLIGTALDSKTDPGKILAMIKALSIDGDESGAGGLKDFFENGSDVFSGKAVGRDTLDGFLKLDRFVDILRSVNLQTSANEPVGFSLAPCFFSSSSGWGNWMFSAEKDGGASANESAYTLDFFLDMSRIGEIYISAQVGPCSLKGTFQVEKEEVRVFLNTQIPELKQLLFEHGYSEVSISCRKVDREVRQILKETIEEKGRYENVSLVNLQV